MARSEAEILKIVRDFVESQIGMYADDWHDAGADQWSEAIIEDHALVVVQQLVASPMHFVDYLNDYAWDMYGIPYEEDEEGLAYEWLQYYTGTGQWYASDVLEEWQTDVIQMIRDIVRAYRNEGPYDSTKEGALSGMGR